MKNCKFAVKGNHRISVHAVWMTETINTNKCVKLSLKQKQIRNELLHRMVIVHRKG